MNTVYQSVANWLNAILTENELSKVGIIIDLEMIPNWQEYSNAGLYSSPNDIHTPLTAGGQKHEEFKSFYFRRSFGEISDRLSNEEFFEKFRQCVYEKNINGDFPKNDGRKWRAIIVNGGIYPSLRAEDNQTADYLIPLRLEYYQ